MVIDVVLLKIALALSQMSLAMISKMTLDALNTVETVDVGVSLVLELGPVEVSSELVALILLAEAVLGRFTKVFGDVCSIPMGMSVLMGKLI